MSKQSTTITLIILIILAVMWKNGKLIKLLNAVTGKGSK